MAIYTLLTLSIYGRPADLFIRRRDLVRPVPGVTRFFSVLLFAEERGLPSKTGHFNDSVILDDPALPFLEPLLHELLKGDPDAPLWDFNYGEYVTQFKKVAQELQLTGVVP